MEVTKQGGGAPSKAVPVTLKVEVDATSGGHDHGETVAPRPKGSLSTTSGMTKFPVTFTAEEVSGKHTITATCDLCSNSPKTATVEVKVPGLQPIPDSQFYSLTEPTSGGGTKPVGATKQHAHNHFLTPEAASVLWRIAAAYYFDPKFMVFDVKQKTLVNPPLLYLNDASLEGGGKFDIAGAWTGEHSEHKRGTVIDIRANPAGYGTMPFENFKAFEKVSNKTPVDVNSSAFANAAIHCTQDKKGTPPSQRHDRKPRNNCISALDGSQDNGRHFHIRLMGVKE